MDALLTMTIQPKQTLMSDVKPAVADDERNRLLSHRRYKWMRSYSFKMMKHQHTI